MKTFKEKLESIIRERSNGSITIEQATIKILALIESDIVGDNERFTKPKLKDAYDFRERTYRNELKQEQREKLR